MAHSFDIESYNKQVSSVWRATLALGIITVMEVAAALLWIWVLYPEGGGPRMLLNVFFIMASLLKAYFIVGEFMHIKYEKRALVLTVLLPTILLIWFIIAFLWDGAEWLNLRNLWGLIETLGGGEHHGGGHGGGGH